MRLNLPTAGTRGSEFARSLHEFSVSKCVANSVMGTSLIRIALNPPLGRSASGHWIASDLLLGSGNTSLAVTVVAGTVRRKHLFAITPKHDRPTFLRSKRPIDSASVIRALTLPAFAALTRSRSAHASTLRAAVDRKGNCLKGDRIGVVVG